MSAPLDRYVVPDLPAPFCPGCSHTTVVEALGQALARLGRDPRSIALVSDIGCVGLLDRHFRVHTFHGLHGRSVTYAAGLKLARPELSVVVAMGDGALGIGGHHVIQAARRGDPVTVLVFDNFNYGMTGGQTSSTTPEGAFTSTSPDGSADPPLDPCALVLAAGATFVARASSFDPELPTLLERALAHPGFALVDVWEVCTAHFMPANDFRRSSIDELSRASGRPFGVLRDEPPRPRTRPAPSPPPERADLTPRMRWELPRPLRLVIAGSAGQRVRSAALALARAAVQSGLHATQKDDYPITVRTGHSIAELVISPERVVFTGIEAPDAALVLAPEGARRAAALLAAMPEDALVLVAEGVDLPRVRARVLRLPTAEAARAVGKENLALWAVACGAARLRAVPIDALRDVVDRHVPEVYRARAARAVAWGEAAAARLPG